MSNTRVRKPPGGDSTFNIFGIPNEPAQNKKTENQKPAEAIGNQATEEKELQKADPTTAAENEVNENAAAANEGDENNKETDEETKESKEKETDTPASYPETNEPIDTTIANSGNNNQNTSADSKTKQRAGYNPITGEAYGKADKTDQQTEYGATRVRQPPGGASSKLW